MVVAAQRLAQIRDAVKWAKEEKLRLVIWGGADAWRMADELAKADVPVIVDSPLELPRREDEPYDAQFSNAGMLARAGVRVLFNEGGGERHERAQPAARSSRRPSRSASPARRRSRA